MGLTQTGTVASEKRGEVADNHSLERPLSAQRLPKVASRSTLKTRTTRGDPALNLDCRAGIY
eukprot:9335390-Pyramimonas_sp.AAC.2